MGFSPADIDMRKNVAREAATLLYFGLEKEYKQAKLRAAKTLGAHFLPTNLEVAVELDRIAEENEGATRMERLINMRREAVKLMKILEKFSPALIGSVWRGTIYRESDIDIVAYHNEPYEILKLLERRFKVLEFGWTAVTKRGKPKKSFRILLEMPSGEKAEISVRGVEEIGVKETCEIYGDTVTGLSIQELEKLLVENPTKRFVPF
ncbi:nucleotidyltransferase domain-containing protein [Candidatus Bathyarchaeota archaeon]|nr:nucleotidyltransferase domain-containing protein [Candidatus Bathyarchaeota archaeon]